MGKDVEGSGRGIIWGTVVEFAWHDWWKLRKFCQHCRYLGRHSYLELPYMKPFYYESYVVYSGSIEGVGGV